MGSGEKRRKGIRGKKGKNQMEEQEKELEGRKGFEKRMRKGQLRLKRQISAKDKNRDWERRMGKR